MTLSTGLNCGGAGVCYYVHMNPGNHPYKPEAQRAEPEAWQSFALCREVDPDLMIPEARNDVATQAAKRVCAMCVVRDQCLEANLDEPYGVWGGTTVRERKQIRITRLGLHLVK